MNQSKDSNPTVIARETLRQLASLKVPPTPVNYHKLYNQIAGISEVVVKADLPIKQPTNDAAVDWGETIGLLLKQLESRQGALTVVKKREGINRVLAKFSGNANQLHDKLKSLIDSWGAVVPPVSGESEENTQTDVSSGSSLSNDSADTQAVPSQQVREQSRDIGTFVQGLLELLAHLLENVIARQLGDQTLMKAAAVLARRVRKIREKPEMDQFADDFQQFCDRLETYGEEGLKLRQGLLRLLHMLIDNTGKLLSEDQWVATRISQLRETLSSPLDVLVLEQAERYVQEITQRQEMISRSLSETKVTLKQLVASLIVNIETLTDTTGEYQERLEQYSEKISKANDIKEINQLLVLIMEETRQMQISALNHRNDFLAARAEVSLAQNKINQLEAELQQIGEKVQEDHLTGILNRRGLDSAFDRETSRATRQQNPLCFALLDIDNFKKLNDTHGHQVGDEALVYLAESIKSTIRPEDSVSRYGGEEFVILLPNTKLDEAVQILFRIRRNLTKKFFLHENNRLLITFSAGVAQLIPGESKDSIYKRADDAMYRAKKGGKNQIITAE